MRGRQKSNKKQKRKVSAENKTLSNDVFTWQKHQRFVVSQRNGIDDTLTENVEDDKRHENLINAMHQLDNKKVIIRKLWSCLNRSERDLYLSSFCQMSTYLIVCKEPPECAKLFIAAQMKNNAEFDVNAPPPLVPSLGYIL